MKTIAFYLPQFHTIPENDEWWGKGFTEWTNVKKAVKYSNSQYQPRVPLNDNYYDLSEVDTLRNQSVLAKKHSIEGFCFYHYWFNGKMLLEKPAELLLDNPDIDIDICFSWANEPWARTWDGKNKKVLMPQEYGNREDWKNHFDYLLPFFKDKRYIKEDNKPMFIIYKTQSMPKCVEMMHYWDQLAKDNGLNGVFFVETLRGEADPRELPFSASVEFEPARTDYLSLSPVRLNFNRFRRRLIRVINQVAGQKMMENKTTCFKSFYNKSLSNLSKPNTFGGVFMGWDNTARKGTQGNFHTLSSKSDFKDYFKRKVEITQNIYKTNYVFINSWNEWCEGTYLEPDEYNRYNYLEAVNEVIIELRK